MAEEKLKIKKPKDVAGGMGAITSTVKISLAQMGLGRSLATLTQVNQKDGFDCPGCAWPDPDDRRSLVEFCENGAKALAEEATRKVVGRDFFQAHSLTALREKPEYWLSQQGRLSEPFYLKPGSQYYVPISWESAFGLIAEKLNALSSPNEAVFYTSGRTSNEAAFLYQLFARLYGTNNLSDCSNMCHESSGVALTETIGSGKGSVRLSDFEKADCILVIGQNPGTNHPRMLTALQKAARRGCLIVAINPLREAGLVRFKHPQEVSGLLGRGTPLATHFLQVRVNGDVALLKGILKALLEEEERQPRSTFDWDFIYQYTEGVEALLEDLRAESWNAIVEQSGVTEPEIREVAGVIGKSKRVIACWAMGLTQHKNAVANIQQIVNLLLLKGQFGKEGAGACPVRGHSNVQGDRTMGIWEAPSGSFLSALGKEFAFEPPQKHGYHTVGAIRAMHEGKVKVFFAMGGNFLSAGPDTEFTEQALGRCDLTVHVSTKLNRSHVVTGKAALILPCLARSERDLQKGIPQFVSVENSMGIVHSSQGTLPPASPFLKSEIAIIAGLAEATFQGRYGIDWDALAENYDRIREHIARVIPGFENFNTRVRTPGGFELPHPVRDALVFKTPSGRAHFTVHPIPCLELAPGELLMMTVRSHDQYNTTVYGLDDRYRGIYQGRRVVLMNASDMEARNLRRGDRVHLSSHYQGQKRVARAFFVVDYELPKGCVATYFPEANPLIPVDSFADKSHTPTSKSVIIRVEPA